MRTSPPSISSTRSMPGRSWRRSGAPTETLPERDRRSSTKDQDAFLDQAVAGLAQDGKVVSVRLALFAEMVKGKPWTPATLREVGGTRGRRRDVPRGDLQLGTAPIPSTACHQKAAQAVLKALLPETGTDIKGQMRSVEELREASGYADRPARLRRPDPHPRHRAAADHADRPGGLDR